MVHLCKQCQCLPICFITFDLTNQKQELKNFDCKTSWLVYICELILARAKPYRNVLKLSFINDKSWRDGCANLCPWSLGKRRNSTSVYSIPVELNFNHRRGGHCYFLFLDKMPVRPQITIYLYFLCLSCGLINDRGW